MIKEPGGPATAGKNRSMLLQSAAPYIRKVGRRPGNQKNPRLWRRAAIAGIKRNPKGRKAGAAVNTALTIQERLKDLRVERGLTLERLEQRTGISRSALVNGETEE